jgi:hypothetical protein
MNEIQLFESPLPHLSYAALYQATWDQIIKDFSHFCLPYEIAQPPHPESMLDGIVHMLESLQGDTLKLNSLFYRVDLSEKKQIPNGNMHALAMMILRREAQKVWIRSHYSSASPKQD